jgi:hypothetical protein
MNMATNGAKRLKVAACRGNVLVRAGGLPTNGGRKGGGSAAGGCTVGRGVSGAFIGPPSFNVLIRELPHAGLGASRASSGRPVATTRDALLRSLPSSIVSRAHDGVNRQLGALSQRIGEGRLITTSGFHEDIIVSSRQSLLKAALLVAAHFQGK